MNETTEIMNTWGRIADTAITALKEQISRLQKERDELKVERDKLMGLVEHVQEQKWRPVSSPPANTCQVLIADGCTYRIDRYDSDNHWWKHTATSEQGRIVFWMPIPKLPEVDDL
jgi:hypothetical protein